MRRGLLGKGASAERIVAAQRTSPVERGKTVMQVFLGVSPPDPPPNVATRLTDQGTTCTAAAKPTMRQQMEMHRKNEPCTSCHKIMDPIGFAHGELRRGRAVAHHR